MERLNAATGGLNIWLRTRPTPRRYGLDAVIYAVSDNPLLEKTGQYRAQGRDLRGQVVQLVA